MRRSNLILEVDRQEESLFMSLYEKEETTSTLRHYLENKVSLSEIGNLCNEINSLLNKIVISKELTPEEELKKIAHLLFTQLFHRRIKERLNSLPEGENVTIFIDEGLVYIPWEILYTCLLYTS
ncbi:MAG: hypothetical protein N2Z79_03780, partial [Candidatus Omnitrophica bacterium]|nr:hypothetical protein [Candidatus Omnitrophota bacterium]